MFLRGGGRLFLFLLVVMGVVMLAVLIRVEKKTGIRRGETGAIGHRCDICEFTVLDTQGHKRH